MMVLLYYAHYTTGHTFRPNQLHKRPVQIVPDSLPQIGTSADRFYKRALGPVTIVNK